MVIGKMLERLEVECAIVGDGSRAGEAVQQDRFELLLMDCQMPEMDGYEATRALRRDWAADQIPIVALTADASDESRERCRQAGMNDHLSKPLTLARLAARLERWLRAESPSRLRAS